MYTFDSEKGVQIPRKAVLYLLLEYMYKILFYSNFDRPLSDVVAKEGKNYVSEKLYGVQLGIFLLTEESAGKPLLMQDIGRAIRFLLEALNDETTWESFSARLVYEGDPEYWLRISINPDIKGLPINSVVGTS